MTSLLYGSAAQAKDLCTVYRNYNPLPSWYEQLCKGGGGFDGLKSIVGGSYSTYADAFNLNPASLPTISLPLGVEAVASTPTGSRTNSPRVSVNAIKGFSNFGAGIGTDSNNSIYSNRGTIPRRITTATSTPTVFSVNNVTPAPAAPSVNFATAFSLGEAWFPKIGGVLRYNSDVKNWSPGVGGAMSVGPISLGTSAIFEQALNYYPKITVLTYSVGIRLFKIQFDYTLISNVSSHSTTSVNLFSMGGNILGFTLNAAARSSSSISASIYHAGIQYVFSTNFALSYLYNYIPGYQSLSAQVML